MDNKVIATQKTKYKILLKNWIILIDRIVVKLGKDFFKTYRIRILNKGLRLWKRV